MVYVLLGPAATIYCEDVMRIARFEDIVAWQYARVLVKDVYCETAKGPGRRDFTFRNQICSAALSVMNNIAEGFSRESRVEFARFLDIARASAREVQSLLYTATDLGYVDDAALKRMRKQVTETAFLITRLRTSLNTLPRPRTQTSS
ncbi:MAG TPA: four helix bundle protein [Candidatus Kapabacteria bacterium]|nr:four helix bundle protein [Candidatus Kapabacteria bacterium]